MSERTEGGTKQERCPSCRSWAKAIRGSIPGTVVPKIDAVLCSHIWHETGGSAAQTAPQGEAPFSAEYFATNTPRFWTVAVYQGREAPQAKQFYEFAESYAEWKAARSAPPSEAPPTGVPQNCQMCATGKSASGEVFEAAWTHIRGEYSWRHPLKCDRMMSIECTCPGFVAWIELTKKGAPVSYQDAFSAGLAWQASVEKTRPDPPEGWEERAAALQKRIDELEAAKRFQEESVGIEWSDRGGSYHPTEFYLAVMSCALDHCYDRCDQEGIPYGIPDNYRKVFAPIVAKHLSAIEPNWVNVTVSMALP